MQNQVRIKMAAYKSFYNNQLLAVFRVGVVTIMEKE